MSLKHCIALSAVLLSIFVGQGHGHPIEIREADVDGWKAVEIENDFYRVVLIPQIDRIPYACFAKPAGEAVILRARTAATPSLPGAPADPGGLLDLTPWLPEGFDTAITSDAPQVRRSPWTVQIHRQAEAVAWEGSRHVVYEDPLTGAFSTLLLNKKVTGYAGYSHLRMDYSIRNDGQARARFAFAVQGVLTPHGGGTNAYVHRPGADRGPSAADVPAEWCAVGDADSDAVVFWLAGPIRYVSGSDIMKMAVTKKDAGFDLRTSLSYPVPFAWDRVPPDDGCVALEGGETCAFSLWINLCRGLRRDEVQNLFAVFPECLLLEEPHAITRPGHLLLKGRLMASGPGDLLLQSGTRTIGSSRLSGGPFDLKELAAIPWKPGSDLTLSFRSPAGERELYTVTAHDLRFAWPDWSGRMKLRVERARIPHGDLRDFPLLVDLQDPALRSLENGGDVAREDGADLRFSDGATGGRLPSVIERFDPVTGELRAWMKAPLLSSSRDTVLYLYYGNARARSRSAGESVWDVSHDQVADVGELFTGEEGGWTLRRSGRLNIKDRLTVEAWVQSQDDRPATPQPLVSAWQSSSSFEAFDAYDAARTFGLDTTGYLGAVFDGRYVYFVPQHDTMAPHGKVLRYDTHGAFTQAESWLAHNAGLTGGQETRGFCGAVHDGRYVYFVPGPNRPGPVLRYDTARPFDDDRSWAAHDPDTEVAYRSGGFDGRYVYFAPGQSADGTGRGEVLRYDTLAPFSHTDSWSEFDAGPLAGSRARDFGGAAFDGRHLYFVPFSHGVVLRYDTTERFAATNSWATFDAGAMGLHSGLGAVFDGRHLYLASCADTNRHGVVRYDTRQAFGDPSSWCYYGNDPVWRLRRSGYAGGFFDGRYVHFVPLADSRDGRDGKRALIHGEVLRFDAPLEFDGPAGWRVADAARTSGMMTVGYGGGAFDGRYFYFAPWHDGTGFQASGRIVGHGRVLRYDTVRAFGAFTLRYSDVGHNGGLNGALLGPRFMINTEQGVRGVSVGHPLPPGRHQLVGIYDGDTLSLFVDGERVKTCGATGRIVSPDERIAVGGIQNGLGTFNGQIERILVSDQTRSAAWVAARYANDRAPRDFCRSAGTETQRPDLRVQAGAPARASRSDAIDPLLTPLRSRDRRPL